jgi:membrane fusion protein (multidrug efflux system)
VLKGVNEGDMIVTAGQLKLHNGSPVSIDNSITPTADASPVVPIDR